MATFVLLIVGGIVVDLISGVSRGRARAGRRGRRADGAGVDQATKAIAVASLDRGEEVNVFLGLDLTYVRNEGVAFGALSGGGPLLVIVIALALAGCSPTSPSTATCRCCGCPSG